MPTIPSPGGEEKAHIRVTMLYKIGDCAYLRSCTIPKQILNKNINTYFQILLMHCSMPMSFTRDDVIKCQMMTFRTLALLQHPITKGRVMDAN